MRWFCRIALILYIGIFALGQTSAPLREMIVVCSTSELSRIRTRYGAAIVDALVPENAYLIVVPSHVEVREVVAAAGNGTLASQNFDLDMQDAFAGADADTDLSWHPVPFYSSNAPSFYTAQPAARQIKALGAHAMSTGKRSLVAIIDTGIAEHPVLSNSLMSGKNYVANGAATEWNDPSIDQSHAAAFDLLQSHAAAFDLDQSHAAVFDLLKGNVRVLFTSDEYASFTQATLPAAFGHGTMVAGIIHLVAPEALLMPMKAFDGHGRATLWNVIRAIRDSADMGAHVINMSFSTPDDPATSMVLRKLAIDYAKASNIALVAAAGNRNQEAEMLPASIEPVVSVAGVTSSDIRAEFSNVGEHIDLSAPATHVVTTYPGTFAVVSGTSFATPFVSGLYALLKQIGIDGSSSRGEIEAGTDSIWEKNHPLLKDKLGKGRINAYQTLKKKF